MCSLTLTSASTRTCSQELDRLCTAIERCDAVVIGAGSGLSTAAGLTYTGERLQRYFADFVARYGFTDMYSGGFFPFPTEEERWAYWSRYIWINRYAPLPSDLYQKLLALVADKDHFVLTTNVDHCFQCTGFDKQRLFYTQGDYGLWQCSEPCHAKSYDNRDAVRQMVEAQGWRVVPNGELLAPEDGASPKRFIPTSLIPHCPVCGKPMAMNLRADDTFVEDKGWHAAAARYQDFLRRHRRGRVLYLEIGVGGNTPVIIKFPFWRMTAENPRAIYACVNPGEAFAPAQIADRSILIDADATETIAYAAASRTFPRKDSLAAAVYAFA